MGAVANMGAVGIEGEKKKFCVAEMFFINFFKNR